MNRRNIICSRAVWKCYGFPRSVTLLFGASFHREFANNRLSYDKIHDCFLTVLNWLRKPLEIWGGEIYVKKIPSMKVTDLARLTAPDADLEEVGVRPGENHEQMIGVEDAHNTYDYGDYFEFSV